MISLVRLADGYTLRLATETWSCPICGAGAVAVGREVERIQPHGSAGPVYGYRADFTVRCAQGHDTYETRALSVEDDRGHGAAL